MAEYKHFDGEDFVTFDILSVNAEKKEVEVAITNRGKITVTSFEILYCQVAKWNGIITL